MAATRFGVLARQFSTSANRTQLVTAPIQLFGIEGRYAHALFSAASKEKKLEAVEKELKDVQALLKQNPKLAEFLASPVVKRQEKQDVLQKVLTQQKASNITTNLFAAIAENGRVTKVSGILSAFGQIMSAYRGEVSCSVTTAKALDATSMKQLEAALQGFVKKGEKLQITTQVDPSIIGGMIVNIGDKFVDMSIATKIKT